MGKHHNRAPGPQIPDLLIARIGPARTWGHPPDQWLAVSAGVFRGRPAVVDEFKPYLDDHGNQGCTNAWEVWEAVVSLGRTHSYQRARSCFRTERPSVDPLPRDPAIAPPCRRPDRAALRLPHVDSLTLPWNPGVAGAARRQNQEVQAPDVRMRRLPMPLKSVPLKCLMTEADRLHRETPTI